MVAVTWELYAREGREDELAKQLLELAIRVRDQEPGCRLYLVTRSKHDPRLFMTVERYDDDEVLAAHSHAPHFAAALPELMGCLETPPRVRLFAELSAGA